MHEADARMRTGRRRRRDRLAASETRERMLAAGLAELRSTGLAMSLDHINLESLIRRADVPRSSVFRLWPVRDDFFGDLVIELVRPLHPEGYDPETREVAIAVITRHDDLLATPAGRRQVLEEAIRLAVTRNYEAVASTDSWRAVSALIGTLGSLPDDTRARVQMAITEAERFYNSSMAAFFDELLSPLRLRMRAGCTTMDLAVMSAAAIQGLAERQIADSDAVGSIDRARIGGETVPWSFAALLFLGVADLLVEPADGCQEQSA